MRSLFNEAWQWRFCRWTSLLTVGPGEEVHWQMPGTSLYLDLDLNEAIQMSLYYRGAFQPETTYWVMQSVDRTALFIDAGANIGLHTLRVADYYRSKLAAASQAMVLAFEPNPHIYSRLERNLRSNRLDDWVRAYPYALGQFDERADFYLAAQENSLTGSLRSLGRANSQTGETVDVRVVPLSGFLASEIPSRRIGLIKMDIEGAELSALHGARSLLERDRPVLILEINPPVMQAFGYGFVDVWRLLRSLDYRMYRILPTRKLVGLHTDEWPAQATLGDVICYPN